MSGLSLRDRVRSSDIQGRLGVELLLFHTERSQLRWFGHLVRMPPFTGVPGYSNWEETQNTLEGLHISAGLGTSWDPPGGADEGLWGGLSFTAQPDATKILPG